MWRAEQGKEQGLQSRSGFRVSTPTSPRTGVSPSLASSMVALVAREVRGVHRMSFVLPIL